VDVFREVRRVLRADGVCWVNLGDSYVSSPPGNKDTNSSGLHGARTSAKYAERLLTKDARATRPCVKRGRGEVANATAPTESGPGPGLKPKDLVGIPWRVAFALQADGWYFRSDVIWAKPNPMPESVTDRPTKAHEYVFLLTKSARYFFDQEAVREPLLPSSIARGEYGHASFGKGQFNGSPTDERHQSGKQVAKVSDVQNPAGRNVRSVWEIATQPYPEAHFATYPEELVRRCILAGTSERGCCPECGAPWERETSFGYYPSKRGRVGVQRDRSEPDGRTDGTGWTDKPRVDKRTWTIGWHPTCRCLPGPPDGLQPVPCTVLDPFGGSGTTALVARKHGRAQHPDRVVGAVLRVGG
jgi:DNA modification methylase